MTPSLSPSNQLEVHAVVDNAVSGHVHIVLDEIERTGPFQMMVVDHNIQLLMAVMPPEIHETCCHAEQLGMYTLRNDFIRRLHPFILKETLMNKQAYTDIV